MATAGKVAPTWDSNGYDSTKTYEYYTMLMHNNKLWICKKNGTIGIEPSVENSANWFLAMDSSFTDAATLDGHDSDYFATTQSVTDILNGTTPVAKATDADTVDGWNIYNSISELGITSYAITDIVQAMSSNSVFFARLSSTSSGFYTETTNKMPSGTGLLRITRFGDSGRTEVVFMKKTTSSTSAMYICDLDENNWVINGWKQLANADEVLPLTGAKTNGNFTVAHPTSNPTLQLLHETTRTTGAVWKNANQTVMGNIPKDAEVDTSKWATLVLSDINETIDNLLRVTRAGTVYKALHTGNKPSGTYTGNGSATERTINTGGIGNGLLIHSNNGWAIVSAKGAICAYGTTLKALGTGNAYFTASQLVLATTDTILNANGVTYTYQVL